VALGAGRGIPLGPVGHGGGEHRLALPVDLVQRLVAACQVVQAGSLRMVAALAGSTGLGGGAQAAQEGIPGGGADLAQLVPDVVRSPGRFDRVGVAQVA
jgi:hypothetical protein